MLNLNFTMGRQTAFGGGPGMGRFGAGMPGVNGMDLAMIPFQNLLTQAVNTMSITMMTLMTQMMTQQVAILGSSAFGGTGRGNSQSSPLAGFLGGAAANPGANPFGAAAPTPGGGRIPGGKSLYKNGRGMFHKGAPGAPDTYAFENSPAGIKFAAKNNYASIDLDMQITKDGVPVATHWSRPMKKDAFRDPLGKLNKNTKVSDMTLAEVMRLRNKDGQSRIYPVSTMVELLKKHEIAGDFEAKDDPRFATNQVMGYLANLVRNSGIKANLKSIYRGSRTDKILQAAQDHGFWVRIAKAGNGQRKYLGYGQ
jgi:hypothetical protein